MTSGIYQITFPSGKRYIGKSVDIETRWKQHLDKFRKGTAASPMQAEFNVYRRYDQKIIYPCHEDHIDLAEAYLIYLVNPELNTTRPKNPFVGYSKEQIEEVTREFDVSTFQHVLLIKKLERKVADLQEQLDNIPTVAELQLKDAQIKALLVRINQLQTPWWHKIF